MGENTNNLFYSYCVIWNADYPIVAQFVKDLHKRAPIKAAKKIQITDFASFIKKVYPAQLPQKYMDEKANSLITRGAKSVWIIKIEISNPEFLYNKEQEHYYCLQAKTIKKDMREKYSKYIPNYTHGVLCHFTEDENENNLLKNAISYQLPSNDAFIKRINSSKK